MATSKASLNIEKGLLAALLVDKSSDNVEQTVKLVFSDIASKLHECASITVAVII